MANKSIAPASVFGASALPPIRLIENGTQVFVVDPDGLIKHALEEVGATFDEEVGHWVAPYEATAALEEAITRHHEYSNLQVWKSNAWIRDSFYEMPLSEMRIVAAAISRLRRTSEEIQPVEFSVRELCQILDISAESAYGNIKTMAPRLAAQVIHIHDPEIGRHDWVSLCDMTYFDGDGRLQITFHKRLRPHLLRLKEKFTVYGLRQILSLTSPYQIRLYEWLKSWQYVRTKRELIEALMRVMGVDEKGSYKNFFTFHGRILKPAVSAINTHTDLEVSYSIERKNRLANAVVFAIRAKSGAIAPPPPLESTAHEEEQTLMPLSEDDPPSVVLDAEETAAIAFISYWNQRMTKSPFGSHSPSARSHKIAQQMRTDPLFFERWKDLVDVVAESPIWNGRGPNGAGNAFHATPKWFLAHLPEVADELAARDRSEAKKRKRREKAASKPQPAPELPSMDRTTGLFEAVKRELGGQTEPATT